MIKLIQRILDERKACKREEYLNEWKAKEPDLYKKMESENFLENLRQRLNLCIITTWVADMRMKLMLEIMKGNSGNTKTSWKNWVLSLKNIYRDPWGTTTPPRENWELRTETEVENGRGFDSRFCSE